jgi:transcriptional regulator with XRE-family HTH domain
MGFTENFNYCMEQRNYSAYRFAKILGVNIQSPVNWKTGASIPHYGTRQKIAEHFGITLAELDGDKLPVLPPEGAKKAPAAKGEGSKEAASNFIKATNDRAALLALINEATKKLQELE